MASITPPNQPPEDAPEINLMRERPAPKMPVLYVEVDNHFTTIKIEASHYPHGTTQDFVSVWQATNARLAAPKFPKVQYRDIVADMRLQGWTMREVKFWIPFPDDSVILKVVVTND